RIKFVPTAADDASLSQDERMRGLEFSKALSVRVLSRTWQMLLKGISEVQSASRPVNAAEMVLIRLAHAATLPTLDEALKSLEGGVPSGDGPRPGGGGQASSSGPAASAVATAYAPSTNGGGGQTMRLVASQPQEAAPPRMEVAPVAEAAPEVQVSSLADIAAL